MGEGDAAASAGGCVSLGLRPDATLWAWGRNSFGQLGDGARNDRYTAVPVGSGIGLHPTPEGKYVYHVPYVPEAGDFKLGFGIANLDNAGVRDILVEYFDNDGSNLGQETAAIPANGHAAFMSSLELPRCGWARITANQPLYGLALVFGDGPDPMFDMDFKDTAAKGLAAGHVDTGGGWVSLAMLANPGDVQANVTVAFYPDEGSGVQTASLAIPAMGAAQYDLSVFGCQTGSVRIASDQGLAGFLLYDGRNQGRNWVGGLSMIEWQGGL